MDVERMNLNMTVNHTRYGERQGCAIWPTDEVDSSSQEGGVDGYFLGMAWCAMGTGDVQICTYRMEIEGYVCQGKLTGQVLWEVSPAS